MVPTNFTKKCLHSLWVQLYPSKSPWIIDHLGRTKCPQHEILGHAFHWGFLLGISCWLGWESKKFRNFNQQILFPEMHVVFVHPFARGDYDNEAVDFEDNRFTYIYIICTHMYVCKYIYITLYTYIISIYPYIHLWPNHAKTIFPDDSCNGFALSTFRYRIPGNHLLQIMTSTSWSLNPRDLG